MRGRSGRIVLVDRRAPDPAPKGGTSGLESALAIAAGAIGLVGYLYALGGVVLWLRVQTSQLPPDGAIIGADNSHLLAVGARVVAFELLVVGLIGTVIAVIFAAALLTKGDEGSDQTPSPMSLNETWGRPSALVSIVALEIAVLLISVGLSIDGSRLARTTLGIAGLVFGFAVGSAMVFGVHDIYEGRIKKGKGSKSWNRRLLLLRILAAVLLLAALVLAIIFVPLLQGTILLAGTTMVYLAFLVSWPQRQPRNGFARDLVRSGGAWIAVALSTVVALAWVATPPVGFTRAEPLDSSLGEPGAYLDRGDDGVYLGLCEQRWRADAAKPHSASARIRLLSPSESERLRLGGAEYVFDPGGRPSIWQVVSAVVGGDSAATHDAPLSHPLRGRPGEVCAGPGA